MVTAQFFVFLSLGVPAPTASAEAQAQPAAEPAPVLDIENRDPAEAEPKVIYIVGPCIWEPPQGSGGSTNSSGAGEWCAGADG